MLHDPPLIDRREDLFKRFVVDEAGAVLWDLQLSLLEVFTEFPGSQSLMSGSLILTQPSKDEATSPMYRNLVEHT